MCCRFTLRPVCICSFWKAAHSTHTAAAGCSCSTLYCNSSLRQRKSSLCGGDARAGSKCATSSRTLFTRDGPNSCGGHMCHRHHREVCHRHHREVFTMKTTERLMTATTVRRVKWKCSRFVFDESFNIFPTILQNSTNKSLAAVGVLRHPQHRLQIERTRMADWRSIVWWLVRGPPGWP